MKSLLAVGLGVVTIAGLGLSAPASAADRPDVVVVSAAAQDAATRYWTADRMRAARPADDLLRRTVHQVSDVVHRGTTQILASRTASGGLLGGLLSSLLDGGSGGRADRGSLYTGGGTVVRTTGRVFFTLGGAAYACSGSSVRAKNENLVQTAGHCVNKGPGAYATNVIFVPGYKDGQAPYGRWAATKLATTTQWRTQGDLTYDVGYIRVKPSKKSLADTVGAQGIAFNLPRGGGVDVFGYPAEVQYDGRRLAACHGTVVQDRRGSGDQGIDCNLTGGTSGGPWIADFDPAKGAGVITSVSSFRYVTGIGARRWLYGPYFGSVVQSLYSSMQKQ